jgi:hypothetical protein
MSAPLRPRYSKEEFARRGNEIYERDLKPRFSVEDDGKFVAIDIETGDYEIDADELAASDRLLARYPEAQIWLRLIGSRYTRRMRLRGQRIRYESPTEPVAESDWGALH